MSSVSRWRDSGHLERAVKTAGGQEAFDSAVAAMLDDARGWRLAEMRKRRGLTQDQVATRMGVSVARVSQIESGDVSTQDVLNRFIAALGGTLKLIADFGDEQLKIALSANPGVASAPRSPSASANPRSTALPAWPGPRLTASLPQEVKRDCPVVSGQSPADAWPEGHATSRTSDHVAFASGALTCMNASFEGLREHIRHVAQETADAVWVYAHPRFKSLSLRQLTGSFRVVFRSSETAGFCVFCPDCMADIPQGSLSPPSEPALPPPSSKAEQSSSRSAIVRRRCTIHTRRLTGLLAPDEPHPKKGALLVDIGADLQSYHWSGYVTPEEKGKYAETSTTFTVPASIACTSADTASSFWAGLDGNGDSTVEQDGVEADCAGGSPAFYAWVETYPAPEEELFTNAGTPAPVDPGDVFVSTVTEVNSSNYSVTMDDETQGWSFTAELQMPTGYSGEGLTSEVITEAPTECDSSGTNCSVMPLTNFGAVTYSSATYNGDVDYTSSNTTPIELYASGVEADGVGALGTGGAFTVTYGRPTVVVPDVIGRTDLGTAESVVDDANLVAKAAGDSGAGNLGKVTAESPAAGTSVPGGSTVTLTYTVEVTVPNVIGRTDLDTAETTIRAAGLVVKATGDSGVGNDGVVTAESPAAGTKVAEGSTVTLTYTDVKVTVPSEIGRADLDTAEAGIRAAGLVVKATGDSGVGNDGVVTAESPAAGTKVAEGSTVTLTYTVKS